MGLIVLALVSAFSFGAIVRAAFADDYHVTCVGHGFVSGSDPNDGSFFSRVEAGCGSTYRWCKIYNYGTFVGEQEIFDSTSTCNAWSRDFGSYVECASSAHIYDQNVFSEHYHLPTNWCG